MFDNLEGEILMPAYFFGKKLFQLKAVKILSVIFLALYTVFGINKILSIFVQSSLGNYHRYGPIFLQMLYGSFAFFVDLKEANFVEQCSNSIQFWPLKLATSKTKTKIIRNAKICNICVILITVLSLSWSGTIVIANDDDISDFIKDLSVFNYLKPQVRKYVENIFRFSCILSAIAMVAWNFEYFYLAQHFIFQLYLYIDCVENINEGFNIDKQQIDNVLYQKHIYKKLEFLVERYCDFFRWQNQICSIITPYVFPFSICAIMLALSVALPLFSSEDIFANLLFGIRFVCFFLAAFLTMNSILVSGQFIEDESEKIFQTLVHTNWCDWDSKNRQALLLLLRGSLNPIELQCTKMISVNLQLEMKLLKVMYTAISVLRNTKNS